MRREDLAAAAVGEFTSADPLARPVPFRAAGRDAGLEMRGGAGARPPVGQLAIDGVHLLEREFAAVGPLGAGPQLVEQPAVLAHEAARLVRSGQLGGRIPTGWRR